MSAPAPPAPHPFGPRLAIGLVGVLIAALSSGLNDRVTTIVLPDLRGMLGIGYDEASWLTAAYVAAEVAAMMVAAWLAVTCSFRRFAMAVALGFAALGALMPFVHDYHALLALRVIQGLFGGAVPPLLMTAALRFLPPGIKLYGLACYALTATLGPNVATSLAALWTDTVGWQWVYWQIIAPCVVAALMIGYGLPQDPVRLERFKQLDWVGVLFGCGGVAMLVLALEQGERLDWLRSPLIVTLLVGAAVTLPIFLINEWSHPLPLFKLQLLGRRNFAHGLITLAGVLMVIMAGSALPASYLAEVHGYRPLELGPLALTIGLPQILACPLVAALCNIRRLDSRLVMGSGLALLAAASCAGAFLSTAWIGENFYLLQAMHALGQPLAIVPLLMAATGTVQPMEGPFASAMFNTTRGLSTVVGGALVDNFVTEREHLHSNVLLDRVGSTLTQLSARGGTPSGDIGALASLANRVRQQALTMGVADAFLLLTGVALLLVLLLLLLPQRAYPPQAPVRAP